MRRLYWAEQRAGWKLRRTARSLDKNDSTARGCGCGSARKVNSKTFCGANWKNERNEIKLRKLQGLSASAGRRIAALKGGTTFKSFRSGFGRRDLRFPGMVGGSRGGARGQRGRRKGRRISPSEYDQNSEHKLDCWVSAWRAAAAAEAIPSEKNSSGCE